MSAIVSAGQVVKTYSYDPYGIEKNPDPTDTNPFRYCGEYYDAETQNIYLRNRYYDPATGRFITEDPIGDGLNWYVYCGNNPVIFIDPWGLEMDTDEKEFGKHSSVFKRLVELGVSYMNAASDYERDRYHAEAELIRELSRCVKNQNLQQIGLIYPNKVDEAVSKIIQHNSQISLVSTAFNMPKPMSTSILFREIICYNATDTVADNTLDDASMGLGQVKPSTAMAAEKEYDTQNPDMITLHSKDEIINRLKTEKTNIYHVGMVLWHYAKEKRVWIDLDYNYSNCVSVLARYNGFGDAAWRYGEETSQYIDPFIKFYSR